MTRRRQLLASLLLASSAATAGSVVVVKHAGAAPACGNSNVTFWWRLEGATLDSTLDHTAGDSTADITTGATIDTGGPKMGTNGLTSPATVANTYAQFLFNTPRDIATDAAGTASFWLKWASGGARPANGVQAQVFAMNESSANRLRVYLVSDDAGGGFKVQAFYKANSVDMATVTSTAVEVVGGNWYHVRLEWDTTQAAGSDVLRLYVDGVLKAGDAMQTMDPYSSAPVSITLGMQYASALDRAFYFDQLIISSVPSKDLYLCRDLTAYPSTP